MRKWFCIVVIFLVSQIKAQDEMYQAFTAYYLFNVGYTYQNINYFEGGLNVYLVRPNNNIVDVGLTANLGYSDDEFIAIPELQAGYLFNIKNSIIDPYSSNFNAAFWVIRSSISPYHITPEVGISVVDLIDLTAGYGFEYNEHDHVDLEGFKVGLSVRLPFLLFWNDED